MLLGCIGDDFTGSSDLANTLAKQGMTTVQYNGVPKHSAAAQVEAGVVALKSRSTPVADAVADSLAALSWLRDQGCEQFFFKYCSTFDSTREGNIGPVAEALADALQADRVIVCPAFPGTGRSIYQGHLFVNDVLLSESGMQNHPITPMTDPDIRRWLGHQTSFEIGHVGAGDVFAGAAAIRKRMDKLHDDGKRLIVVDALRDEDLMQIGAAAKGLKLVTGGSGVALGLPKNLLPSGPSGRDAGGVANWQGCRGKAVALSGSCSIATRGQVDTHASHAGVRQIDVADVIEKSVSAAEIAEWILAQDGVPLVYSSADPVVVGEAQERFGADRASTALEGFFGDVARAAVEGGIERLIVAGGETSGAVVEALELAQFEIGPEIDPGVPALRARDNLCVALKSGNFGAPDFFSKAARVLAGDSLLVG